jgi:hypothetical protein
MIDEQLMSTSISTQTMLGLVSAKDLADGVLANNGNRWPANAPSRSPTLKRTERHAQLWYTITLENRVIALDSQPEQSAGHYRRATSQFGIERFRPCSTWEQLPHQGL